MELERFNLLMDRLPSAFPASRITMNDGIKEEYWEVLKDFSENDFGEAILAIKRRTPQFPGASVIVQQIESTKEKSQKSDLDRRLEEYQRKKREGFVYTPQDQHQPYDKDLTRDTFAALKAGLSSGDIPAALRQLGEKYPKEKWTEKLAKEIEYESKTTPSQEPVKKRPAGPKLCLKCAKVEVGIFAIVCDGCRGFTTWEGAAAIAGAKEEVKK